MMSDNASTIIFTHIPKAGGMTMRQVVARQVIGQPAFRFYHENTFNIERFLALPESERAALRYVGGHVHFGIHRYIDNPCVYVTLFRDPREQLISYYYFFQQMPNDPDMNTLIKDKSFEEFLQMRRMQAMQLNMIVGLDDAPDPETGKIGARQNARLPLDEKLAIAEKHLRQHYGAIGLTGHFDESMVIMRRRMGWDNIFYLRDNTNPGRPRGQDTEHLKALVEQYAEPDIQFFERVKAIYEEQRAEYGPDLARDLRTYQRNKAIYSRVATLSQSLRQTGLYRRLRVIGAGGKGS